MTSPYWGCPPQYRWHPVYLLCAWPPPAPASPLEPHVSPLGGARPAKLVSKHLLSKSYSKINMKTSVHRGINKLISTEEKKIQVLLDIHLRKDLFVPLASSQFLLCSQQALATSSRLPCLCSALLSASSTGATTESLMLWSVLVLLECPPAR